MADIVPVTFKILGLQELKVANAELKRMGGSSGTVATTTGNTKKFGNAATNASYQVQDLIVQIQGGTDVSRALSQQLPQMVVGFGLWGAAIGLAAAAIPALIVGLRDTTEEAIDSADAVDNVEGAISGLGRTLDTVDLSGFIEEFNKADAAGKRLLSTMLDLDLRQAARDLATAGKAIQAQYDEILEPGFFRTPRPTETFDISNEQAGNLGEAIRRLQEANPDMERLNENIAILSNFDGTTEEYQKLVDDIIRATIAYENLTEAAAKSAEAQTAAAGGGTLSTPGGASDETLAAIAANDLKQMQIEAELFEATLLEAAKATETSFDIGKTALETFGQTFDSVVDGIARGTNDLDGVIKAAVSSMLLQLGKLAAYQFIANAFAGSVLGDSAASLLPSAQGNVIAGGNLVPFAKGGVVSSPTIFPMASGAGLMSERGPEAIMPLKRTPSGDLGVQASPMNITINNKSAGVEVVPRQDDAGLTIDIIERGLATAIRRGGGVVASALEDTYRVNRGRGAY